MVCEEGDDWRDEIDTVGVLLRRRMPMCTGFMVNNTDQDGTPYFMTAYHCDVRANLAPSLVVYWNFQSPVCGQQGGGSLDDSQSGATLRAEYPTSDLTLLELDELPDPAFGVKYAGWNRDDVFPTSAVCIHHPSTDEKSISFENDPLIGDHLPGQYQPRGRHPPAGGGLGRGHHRAGFLGVAPVRPGSPRGGPASRRGRGLRQQPARLVRPFTRSWDGGGTPAHPAERLARSPGTGCEDRGHHRSLRREFHGGARGGFESSGVQGGPFEPDEMVYTLTNTGTSAAMFTAAVAVTGWRWSPAAGRFPSAGIGRCRP